MSQAEELLTALAGEQASTYTAPGRDEPYILIGNDRIIMVPDELKRIAVQYDHNIETVTFKCPRYWDAHDMSEMAVYINYRLRDKSIGCYIADHVRVDSDDDNCILFDWTIKNTLTQLAGPITVQVCIKRTNSEGTETVHWNSELNKDMYVAEGMECGLVAEPDAYTDLLTQVLLRTGYASKIGYVTLYGSKWVGDTSPYSQIVEIEGVTENSQVDLTPNADQLAIFHNKDLAFVTENDGGIVTVYAIGQKPANDYTIQVTITEVNT